MTGLDTEKGRVLQAMFTEALSEWPMRRLGESTSMSSSVRGD